MNYIVSVQRGQGREVGREREKERGILVYPRWFAILPNTEILQREISCAPISIVVDDTTVPVEYLHSGVSSSSNSAGTRIDGPRR